MVRGGCRGAWRGQCGSRGDPHHSTLGPLSQIVLVVENEGPFLIDYLESILTPGSRFFVTLTAEKCDCEKIKFGWFAGGVGELDVVSAVVEVICITAPLSNRPSCRERGALPYRLSGVDIDSWESLFFNP